MNITVVGTGYVGLVSGTCLAEVGNNVLCVDTDSEKIDGLKTGMLPIYEPGLESMVVENIASSRLSFTTDIVEGVAHGDVVFIAVGTPPDEDGSADLQYVKQVAKSIGECIDGFRVIATKSTVPVGTSEIVRNTIKKTLDERGVSIDYAVVSNPEFLKEGAAVEDFMRPDRIVVGVDNEQALEMLRALYAPFNRNHDRLIVMDVPSAEMTKYAANAMLATKISFMNEMSNIAERLGADIEAVRIGIGADPRIGYSFIYPGCGYGGSCFPKDVQALHRTAKAVDYDARLLDVVESVNFDQKRVPVQKITNHFGTDLSGKVFALWGLSFKPDTDDMRDAPSRVIMESLWEMGASVQAYDPVAVDEAKRIYGNKAELTLFDGDPYDALNGADCLVIATEWRVFRGSDVNVIKEKLKGDVIVDGRNIFSPESVRNAGLQYYGIGRQ